MSNRMDTIWSQLDRKSTAIAEFTLRQYRTRISTWVVMIASVVALFLVLLFYIEAMNTEIEAIDNDGDSFDNDGDGFSKAPRKKHIVSRCFLLPPQKYRRQPLKGI